MEETISQSAPQVRNTDVGLSHQGKASAATSTADQQQLKLSECSGTLTRNRKQTDRLGESIPTNLFKKNGGCDGFNEASRNLEVFSFNVSHGPELDTNQYLFFISRVCLP